ncbi:MAG: hypothetical protein GY811_13600 [Myxococcales bacterium]|nr:hypothetical protein [Myxococcales bacterium]
MTEVLVVAGAIQGDSHPGAKGVPIGEIIESALVVIECLDLASRHDGLA